MKNDALSSCPGVLAQGADGSAGDDGVKTQDMNIPALTGRSPLVFSIRQSLCFPVCIEKFFYYKD
jgi:hypothetical protein